MTCQPGYHQHTGADGQTMLACHPISQKHTNLNTRRAHESALTENPSSTRDSEQTKRISDKPNLKQKQNVQKPDKGYTKSNVAGQIFGLKDIEQKKRQYAQRFAQLSGKDKKHLPLVAMWFAMGQVARIYDLYNNVKNEKAVKNVRAGYLQGWQTIDSIITGDEESEIDTPEKADKLKMQVLSKYNKLKANPNSQKPNTREYGELKVYSDYLKYIDKLLKQNERRKKVEMATQMASSPKRKKKHKHKEDKVESEA